MPRYRCAHTRGATNADGTLSDAAWRHINWTERFVGIEDGDEAPAGLSARCKMAWNSTGFYLFAHLAETSVVATVTNGGPAILRDNTFEMLLDPDGDGRHYYELQINALGTCWELCLAKPYRDGGEADLAGRVVGLCSATQVHGRLNDATHQDQGWDVALALPWTGLAPYQRGGTCPPRVGDLWRMNLARLQWSGGQKSYWVWSVQGEINLHAPSRWGEVEFVG